MSENEAVQAGSDPTLESELQFVRPKGLGNQMAAAMLRSPLHRALSQSVCLISYDGHHSGRRYTTPVQYVPSGTDLIILVGAPEEKTWWRNFQAASGYPVDVMLKRVWTPMTARSVEGTTEPDLVAKLATSYAQRFPRAASLLNNEDSNGPDNRCFVWCTPRSLTPTADDQTPPKDQTSSADDTQ